MGILVDSCGTLLYIHVIRQPSIDWGLSKHLCASSAGKFCSLTSFSQSSRKARKSLIHYKIMWSREQNYRAITMILGKPLTFFFTIKWVHRISKVNNPLKSRNSWWFTLQTYPHLAIQEQLNLVYFYRPLRTIIEMSKQQLSPIHNKYLLLLQIFF